MDQAVLDDAVGHKHALVGDGIADHHGHARDGGVGQEREHQNQVDGENRGQGGHQQIGKGGDAGRQDGQRQVGHAAARR